MYEVKGKDDKSQETRTSEEDGLKRSEGLGNRRPRAQSGRSFFVPKASWEPCIHAWRND